MSRGIIINFNALMPKNKTAEARRSLSLLTEQISPLRAPRAYPSCGIRSARRRCPPGRQGAGSSFG